MFGPAFFLSGDSFPSDSYIERALCARIGPAFSSWTNQHDMLAFAGEPDFGGSVAKRLALFQHLAATSGKVGQSVLFGRSSGARVATLYAARAPVGAVVCLGYPFRHPARQCEADRYAHLAHIATPTLILQGVRDKYGGRNVVADYSLSPNVTVHFLEGSHEFRLSPPDWDEIAQTVLDFCHDVLRDRTSEAGVPI